MENQKRRIGLILANIDSGWAQNAWPSFVKAALAEDKSLFIFPGGRLDAREEGEYLRNPIYSLINSENLDGLISWSSTIRHNSSTEEFERFHSGFDPLPYVTLIFKVPGHPCIRFDAYTGVKLMIIHCIRLHKAKKIAFLRGPAQNQSAGARLKAYEDALKETGIPFYPDSPLVTDPFNWNNGEAAAKQLFEDRKLRPGKDFDTLVGSNDLMALQAIEYFSKQGYRMPRDYHAVGFDNSIESRLAECPLSTVNVPHSALSGESFRLLQKLLEKKDSTETEDEIEDVFLPTEPVIRESCGCGRAHFLPPLAEEDAGEGAKVKTVQSNKEPQDALISMIGSHLKLDTADVNALVTPMIHALFDIISQNSSRVPIQSSEEIFFDLFEKILYRFFDSHRGAELLFGLMEGISRSGLISRSNLSRIEPVLYQTVFKVREQIVFQNQYERGNWNRVMNSLKCDLLGTRDRNTLMQSLALYLPKIGFHTAGLALYQDEKTSLWVGSFSPNGTGQVCEQTFPASFLVPELLRPEFSEGIFMVQPLFIEDQSLGYFVHNVPIQDGIFFEELRSAVSYALKGIFLLEETVRVKPV